MKKMILKIEELEERIAPSHWGIVVESSVGAADEAGADSRSGTLPDEVKDATLGNPVLDAEGVQIEHGDAQNFYH